MTAHTPAIFSCNDEASVVCGDCSSSMGPLAIELLQDWAQWLHWNMFQPTVLQADPLLIMATDQVTSSEAA